MYFGDHLFSDFVNISASQSAIKELKESSPRVPCHFYPACLALLSPRWWVLLLAVTAVSPLSHRHSLLSYSLPTLRTPNIAFFVLLLPALSPALL